MTNKKLTTDYCDEILNLINEQGDSGCSIWRSDEDEIQVDKFFEDVKALVKESYINVPEVFRMIKEITGTIEAIHDVYLICEDEHTRNGLEIEMMRYVKKINDFIDWVQ